MRRPATSLGHLEMDSRRMHINKRIYSTWLAAFWLALTFSAPFTCASSMLASGVGDQSEVSADLSGPLDLERPLDGWPDERGDSDRIKVLLRRYVDSDNKFKRIKSLLQEQTSEAQQAYNTAQQAQQTSSLSQPAALGTQLVNGHKTIRTSNVQPVHMRKPPRFGKRTSRCIPGVVF